MTEQNLIIKPPRESGASKIIDLRPSFWQRGMQGMSYIFSGRVPDWFGPREPLPVQAPEGVGGRQFDYATGININVTPKNQEGVGFGQLRTLAECWDLLRIILETQKDRLCQLVWNITYKDPKKKADKACQDVENWFAMPDKEHTWEEWLRMILEDLYVIDAPCLYPRPARDGSLFALEPVDGATIKRILDDYGRTPQKGYTAYQQILKGLPAADFERDQLIYRPRNVRTNKVYGYSPVEQLIVTVNLALQRAVSMLEYYNSGSTPDLILSVPDGWSPEQIAKFKIWWDAILQGNTAARRGTMFVFNGQEAVNTKDKLLVDKMDEWLARVVCFCFGMSAQPFIQQNNRAAAVSAATQAKEEGLGPGMRWVTNLMNYLLAHPNYFNRPDMRFMFKKDQETDPLTRSQICNLKTRAGAMSVNEWRAADGEEPVEDGDVRMIYTGTAVIPVDEAVAGNAMSQPGTDPAEGAPKQGGQKKDAAGRSNRQQGGPSTRTQNKKPPSRTVNDGAGNMKKAAPVEPRPVTKTEVTLAIELAMVLRGMEKSMLAGIIGQGMPLTGRDPDAVIASAGVSATGMQAPLVKALADHMAQGYAEAVRVLNKAVGPPLAITEVSAYAAARAASLVTQIDETTRAMIRNTVAEAIEKEWSVAELAKALAEEYAFSATRAATIAATEMNDVLTHAELQAWQATGIVKSVQWVTSPGEGVCAICEDNENDGSVPIGETFSSGDDGPPAHPNCRCAIRPVTDEEYP